MGVVLRNCGCGEMHSNEEVGMGRWVWGGGCGEVCVGRCVCGEVGAGRWVWMGVGGCGWV